MSDELGGQTPRFTFQFIAHFRLEMYSNFDTLLCLFLGGDYCIVLAYQVHLFWISRDMDMIYSATL